MKRATWRVGRHVGGPARTPSTTAAAAASAAAATTPVTPAHGATRRSTAAATSADQRTRQRSRQRRARSRPEAATQAPPPRAHAVDQVANRRSELDSINSTVDSDPGSALQSPSRQRSRRHAGSPTTSIANHQRQHVPPDVLASSCCRASAARLEPASCFNRVTAASKSSAVSRAGSDSRRIDVDGDRAPTGARRTGDRRKPGRRPARRPATSPTR